MSGWLDWNRQRDQGEGLHDPRVRLHRVLSVSHRPLLKARLLWDYTHSRLLPSLPKERHAQRSQVAGLVRTPGCERHGTALPFQHPLVVLVGSGSSSGAEVCAGSLQALARAQLAGEQTAGWLGVLRRPNLADGWNFSITAAEVQLSAVLWRLNRIGLRPDLPVIPTAGDERARRDPQIEAAIQLFSEQNT